MEGAGVTGGLTLDIRSASVRILIARINGARVVLTLRCYLHPALGGTCAADTKNVAQLVEQITLGE